MRAQLREHTVKGLARLGEMYASDARFRAHFDRYAKDLADFIRAAIHAFCDNQGRRMDAAPKKV